MKKSITILALAVISFTNASASNLESSLLKDSTLSIAKTENGSETKFVSFADPNLIKSELGNLQKTPKTIDAIIADDIKITEGVIPAKIVIKKFAKKANPVQLKRTLQN